MTTDKRFIFSLFDQDGHFGVYAADTFEEAVESLVDAHCFIDDQYPHVTVTVGGFYHDLDEMRNYPITERTFVVSNALESERYLIARQLIHNLNHFTAP